MGHWRWPLKVTSSGIKVPRDATKRWPHVSIGRKRELKLLNNMSELANTAKAMPVNRLRLAFILLLSFYLQLWQRGCVIFHVATVQAPWELHFCSFAIKSGRRCETPFSAIHTVRTSHQFRDTTSSRHHHLGLWFLSSIIQLVYKSPIC